MTGAAKLEFGLIGAGGIGAVRARALVKSEHCRLSACFDLDAQRARALPGEPRVFDDRRAFFDSDAYDAVVICTPPDTHRELAMEALARGKHVIVEKPMAESLASCRAMIDAAAAAKRVLTVGFNHRYFKGVDVLRRAVRDGTIGRLSWIRAFAGHTGLSEFKSPWMYDRAVMGGGTLMDNGVHVLDLVNHLMSDIREVSAVTRNDFWHLDVEDNAFVHIVDRDGVVCDLHSTWTEWKGYAFFVEAYGDRGMAGAYYAPMRARVTTVDSNGARRSNRRNLFVADMFREKFFGWQSTVVDTFVAELGDFAARVSGRAEPIVGADARDGLMACAVANAAYRSAESGRPVEVAELLGSAPPLT